ncbi:BCCT family transporter, partial [Ammoniphilus sp. 3BR4]|uniref:BCCT family transporter n=1 Tax=Ammoniphilus sp. 3BR4 TaxID=3158265 RepID=UPI003465BD20
MTKGGKGTMAKVFREKTVLVVSLLFTSLFILLGIFFNTKLADAASAFLSTTIDYFGWFYLTAVMLFLLFSVFLMLSRYGSIRLGDDADRPEYSTASWLAMLFSAGMGIGLVFWGAAEPVFHYTTPPIGEGSTAESAAVAMRYTFLHWGLHPWAIYTVIALSLAYAQFRKKMPALISSAFYPLLGERVNGPIGKTVDILAVFATVFGVATSLGLGTMQISGGMSFLFGLENTISLQIGIIVAVTVLYIYTAWSGVDRGIKTLSNLNMILALALMLLLLFVGPTAQIFKILVNTTGSYINNIISMSLRLEPFRDDTWIAGWTLFYWA